MVRPHRLHRQKMRTTSFKLATLQPVVGFEIIATLVVARQVFAPLKLGVASLLRFGSRTSVRDPN